MFDSKQIGKQLSVAICAALFGSTMVLSAVGPARASEPVIVSADQPATIQTTAPLRYLA